MLHGTISDQRLEAIRTRRAEIALEIARLSAEDDGLLIEQGRRQAEAEALTGEPYLVGAKWLMERLTLSKSAFYALVKNPAKGFPKARYGLTSDAMWVWPEVKEYVAGL